MDVERHRKVPFLCCARCQLQLVPGFLVGVKRKTRPGEWGAFRTSGSGYRIGLGLVTEDGVKLAEETRPDVILLDHRLPDGEGPDLARELRRGGPSRAARFVALTANAEAIREARGVGETFHAVLAKPTDSATLARATLGAAAVSMRRASAASAA